MKSAPGANFTDKKILSLFTCSSAGLPPRKAGLSPRGSAPSTPRRPLVANFTDKKFYRDSPVLPPDCHLVKQDSARGAPPPRPQVTPRSPILLIKKILSLRQYYWEKKFYRDSPVLPPDCHLVKQEDGNDQAAA